MEKHSFKSTAVERVRRRPLGHILTAAVPRRVTNIRMNDVTVDRIMRGFCWCDPDRAHAHLVRRLLRAGASLEECASAVFHADDAHDVERAMHIAISVAGEPRCAA